MARLLQCEILNPLLLELTENRPRLRQLPKPLRVFLILPELWIRPSLRTEEQNATEMSRSLFCWDCVRRPMPETQAAGNLTRLEDVAARRDVRVELANDVGPP